MPTSRVREGAVAVRGRGNSRKWAATSATWPAGRAQAQPASWPSWVDRLGPAAVRLDDWLRSEAAPGRLVIWCPVAFGLGVIAYFSVAREPMVWAALGLASVFLVATVLLRARPVGFVAAVLATAAAAGFSTATVKGRYAAHTVLERPLFGVEITGWVEVQEERERTDRVVLQVTSMQAQRLAAPLQRVRVSVRKGTAPAVGSYIKVKARLSPPLGPLRPGGYDFARDLYFQQIGATGFALGKVQQLAPPGPMPVRLRFIAFVAGIRDAIDARIRATLPGDTGSIASALLTGKRDAISAPVNEAMYVSSLAHVLSISGYHMAVVAGVVFFLVRGLLALSATLALRFPIKKWAAAIALVAASAYLVLSGAETATQRAYVMTAIVLIGVMVDRAALTLRTLAIAAVAVMLFSPEAVVHPSFQMSFAATLALIAAYERGMPWAIAGAETSWGARMALWGVREVIALLIASIVAGAATTIYAAYHFHRLAPYGTLANLLAMPVVSAWVMPTGLLGLLAMPFGIDDLFWRMMGWGIDWMIAVALWVANLPGAIGRMRSFGVGPLLLATAGLLLLCLLRSPLRWGGGIVGAIATVAALRTPPNDIVVAPGAEAVAVRTQTGRLAMLKVGTDSFAMRQWLAADADARVSGDPTLADGFSCDPSACIAQLADGTLVSVVLAPDAFEEDCRRAAIVITRRTAPPGCAARVIDRTNSQYAIGFLKTGSTFAEAPARAPGLDRPWARTPVPSVAGTASPALASPDATPRAEDLRPED